MNNLGLSAGRAAPQNDNGPLRNRGGGDTFDPMEARVAKLESDTSFIRTDMGEMKKDVRDLRSEARTDFRILFGALIAVALGLAGLMSRGFGWL